MSIVDCHEIWNGRVGADETGGKDGEGFIARYERVWRVIVDDELDGPQKVMRASGIPKLTDPYRAKRSLDLGSLCHRLRARRESGTRLMWIVSASYSSDMEEVGDPKYEVTRGQGASAPKAKESKAQQQSDPLQRPPKIRISYQRYVRYPAEDLNGTLVMNSSREAFDPPVEVEDLMPVITLTRIYPIDGWSPHDRINDTARNSDTFMNFPAGAVRLAGVAANIHHENGRRYWEVTRVFHVDTIDEWVTKILDFGFREKLGPGLYKEITTRGKEPVPPRAPEHPNEWKIIDPHPLRRGRKAERPAILRFYLYPDRPFIPFLR